MKHLKNNLKVIFFWVSIFLSICFIDKNDGEVPEINIEDVRKDFITHGEFLSFSSEYIKGLEKGKFSIFYLPKYCLVHIAYKNVETESYMKFSEIAVYILDKEKWVYKNIIPYYYNLKLIDKKRGIFLSDNKFCRMNGDCNSYYELSNFDGNDLIKIVDYKGYNKSVYYQILLIKNQINEVKQKMGDTIANEIKLENFEFTDKGVKSFDLKRNMLVLIDLNDSLVTKQIQTETKEHP
ncbi:MAG: hypothetical protein EHM93_17275 [Bacteroidales bacterium]|nr:MAG: hypothetical protein EHM93_17275 [Bacteroidales bacterium]